MTYIKFELPKPDDCCGAPYDELGAGGEYDVLGGP